MVTRLDVAFDRQVLAVRKAVTSYTGRAWLGLGSYRDADARRFRAAVIPRVEAGQKRIAELTDAYISRVAVDELKASVARGTVAKVSTQDLRGVPAAVVYERPFVEMYRKLSDGKSFTAAKAAGALRLASIVTTNLQLATTHSARKAGGRSGVELWMRQLTGRENCGLCVIASTQRYYRGDLMPIHGGCDCIPKPFKGDRNRQVIDEGLLERMHDAVTTEFGGTDRGARSLGFDNYNDFQELVVTNTHGELGPVIGWRHQKFTGPADI